MPTPASPDGRRYRGAVLGAGGIARQSHLPALREAPAVSARVEVAALVDPAPDVPPVDGVPLLRDRAALARIPPLDFVDICTPTASHLELTVWVTVKEWLRGGAIGRWHLAELAVYRPSADPGRSAAGTPWRGTRDAARGGVLLDHGTHLLYQLLDIAGMPRAVSAWTGRLRHRAYDVEDTVALHLEYPGRLATVFCSWAARARETRLRFVGDAGTIEWTDGELRLERDGTVERRDCRTALDKAAYRRWFACLFEAFVGALDAGDPVRAGAGYLEDIGRVAAVLEDAYRAARTGRTVAVADGA